MYGLETRPVGQRGSSVSSKILTMPYFCCRECQGLRDTVALRLLSFSSWGMECNSLLLLLWGVGSWKCLHSSGPPLLLVTFKGVEHALRVIDGGFDMVAKRRVDTEGSLADD